MLGETISHYRVEQRIGSGGMGEVFRAFDTQLERRVAIKRLRSDLIHDPEYRRRFLREARHAAQITHQGVAGVHDVFEKDGEVYLIMEYVEGENLNRAETDRSDLPELLRIAIKCAEALAAAHQIGVIHRDIKPANIMLTHSGEVKILDFGLARRDRAASPSPDSDETETELTEDVGIRGTLAYMPPETLRGRPADHRSDLFSLGIVFYQLFSGEYPFSAETRPSLINNILSGNPAPLVRLNPAITPELEECVFRLLEKDPELRYASAADLVAHLRKIERDLSYTPRHLIPISKDEFRLRRYLVPLGTASALILGFAAFYFVTRLIPAPIPENPVIAVIPFESASEDPVSRAFAVGLSEMVSRRLNEMSLNRPFIVMPSHSVRRREPAIPQDLESLGVHLALTGKQEVRDGNLHSTLQLISVEDGEEVRRGVVRSPLSRPADLEYQILQKALNFLNLDTAQPEHSIIKSYPVSSAAYDYFLRGLGSYLSGASEDAILSLRNALLMEPHFPLARAYLGLTRMAGADPAGQSLLEAANDCLEARNLDHELQIAHLCMAEAASARGDLENARAFYETALQKGPIESGVLNGLYVTYRDLARLEALIPLLESARDREPRLWIVYDYLAAVHFRLGDQEAAVRNEKRVVELAPRRPSGYNYLAVFYDELGCPEQAAENYQKALELLKSARVYTNLAVTRFYSGHYAAALEAAQDAKVYVEREGDPGYTESGNLADVYFWSPGGDREAGLHFYREALTLVNRYLEAKPTDLQGIQSKCWYLAMLEEEEAARVCLASLPTASDLEPDTCYKLALTYQRLGDREQALAYLERSLEQGKWARRIRHEPILREDPAIMQLLSRYSQQEPLCP